MHLFKFKKATTTTTKKEVNYIRVNNCEQKNIILNLVNSYSFLNSAKTNDSKVIISKGIFFFGKGTHRILT